MPRKPQIPTMQSAHLPAPVGGLNTVAPATEVDAGDCLVLNNLVPSTGGLRVRLGYREWCTGLGEEVRTILSYRGSKGDGSHDKLFACTSSGIWDVTASSAAPTQVFTFAAATASSGWGKATAFVNAAASHFLCYCDEENGYHVWDESAGGGAGAWSKIVMGAGAGEIDGVDPASFAFVMGWKNRLWFVQKDTATAWYTDIGALYGTVHAFHFGQKFRYGGYLVGLWGWTVDGGTGIDDNLVGISSGGDVIIYTGTDPASINTFAQKGVWFLGGVPAGRRVASDFGGDLLILSTLGLAPLSKLVAGTLIRDPNLYASRKINNLFNSIMTDRRDSNGWEVRVHPDNLTLVMLPKVADETADQLSMSNVTGGWSMLLGLPIVCTEVWNGTFYFGTTDGRVCINDGYVDNNQLASSANVTAIPWSMVGGFNALGSASRKRLQMVRPQFQTDGTAPQYSVEARYNADASEPTQVSYVNATGAGVWDSGTWNLSLWGAGVGTAGEWRGTWGSGSNVSIALAGASKSKVTLVGCDVQFDTGGVL